MNIQINKWNYNESINKIKPLVIKWKNATIDIVKELWIARNELSTPAWNKKSDGTFVPPQKTWNDYCNDIGLEKRTINRWLERYIPEQNKLLTYEEFKEKKQIESDIENKERQNKNRIINERIKTGEKTNEWNDLYEKDYQKKIKEDKERTERIEEMKNKEKERINNSEKFYFEDNKETEKIIKEAKKISNELKERNNKKDKLFEKMNLTGDNSKEPIYDALLEYLLGLSENVRLEACHNIIKFCKTIANELQVESVK